MAAAPLGVSGSAGRPAARAADHRTRPAGLRLVRARSAQVGQGRRRRRRSGADRRAGSRPGTVGGPRLGRLRRAPHGVGGAGAVRRLSGDEHRAPVGVGRAPCCRICGDSAYQLPLATFGISVQRRTRYVERAIFARGSAMPPEEARVFADRFRHPVCARAGRDTYRTFLARELPQGARKPETRRATVPIRAVFGTGDVVRARLWPHPRPPTPTTTRWKRSTPRISSSTSGRTWCARS